MSSSSVYSERFIIQYGAVHTRSYVVPAGKRAIIKNVLSGNYATGASTASLSIGGTPIWIGSLPGQYSFASFACHVPVYAGETMNTGVQTDFTSLVVAGYLLLD